MNPGFPAAFARGRRTIWRWAFLLALFAGAPFARAATLDVPATANIFGAGHSMTPFTGGPDEGVLPPSYDFGFAAGSGLDLTFSSVTGTVILDVGSGDNSNDPDGIGAGSSDTSVNSLGGISGIVAPNAGFLVGVFENDTEPADPAPLRLNFISIGTNFSDLSPTLNQVFFIGDGLTGDGSGAVQRFHVPIGATRLFLGIADAPGYHGDPGGYSDNSGQFSATFAIVPEPSAIALALIGISMVSLRLLIRRR